MTIVVIAMLLISLVAGLLSDHLGRRPVNALGGLFAAAGAFVLLFVRNVPWINASFISISDLAVAGGLIGIGMGLFGSANWAWAIDLTPPGQAAHFLGLTNIATAGASVVTALFGPIISLLNAQEPGRGFTFMFGVALVGFLLGTAMNLKVRETRSLMT